MSLHSSQPSAENAPSRVALITGGNRGIGRGIADEFIRQGYKVAVTSRSGDPIEGTLTVQCDVTDMNSIDAAFTQVEAELGPVEVLVANAGITDDNLLMRMKEDSFASILDTNLTGAFRCAKRATKGMMKARFGRMIFISSVVAMHGSVGQVNYAASKAGLIGMARSIARELGGRGITANVVAPGFIETAMTAELPQEKAAEYQSAIPAGRFGDVCDIAAAVAFLGSDAASYINGQVLGVDGGLGMGH